MSILSYVAAIQLTRALNGWRMEIPYKCVCDHLLATSSFHQHILDATPLLDQLSWKDSIIVERTLTRKKDSQIDY
jgi:hypothetical protein